MTSAVRITLVLLVAFAAACSGRRAANGAPVPEESRDLADPMLAVPQGEVERTVFAEELNVVLLAMTRLPTGIYYRDLETGKGPSAQPGREVLVTYIAYLADGKEVDRTAPGARPLRFRLGDGVVIRGWDLGVRGMKVGGTRQLVVPPRFAYGARGNANVPPNAVMVFVMRLDGVP
jgi:FKBP-type peptidyl-prolyl cis-trans isomerase